MKRTILATTALVTCGSMAAADVSLSGSAEIGVAGGSNMKAQVHRDARVSFGMSGETDTGLSFGTSLNLRHAGKYQPSGGVEGAIHISGVFGTLTVGNTDGAFDKAMLEVPAGTSIADNSTGHKGWNGNSGLDAGGEIIRYDYSIGQISLALSTQNGDDNVSLDDDGKDTNASGPVTAAHGIGVGWSGEFAGASLGLGAGHQRSKMENISGASLSVSLANGLGLGVTMSRKAVDGKDNVSHAGAGLSYSLGDVTFAVNGGQTKTGDTNANGVGFAAAYSLGAGATFQIGAGSSKKGDESSNSWSAGIALSF
ncbi:MAG: porin [Paracoccaceae bacterium]|nr:porin [Paracoccaceae bacterium]